MPEPGVGYFPYLDRDVQATAKAVTTYPSRMFYVHAINNTVTDVFLQLYDAPAASVVVGTTIPVQTWLVPGGTGANNRGAFEEEFAWPLQFNVAVSIAVTTSPINNTSPSTGAIVNLGYK